MTQREGYTSAGAITVARPSAGDGVIPRERTVRPVVPTTWEAIFQALPRDRQAALLELAGQEGYLHYSQIPQPADVPLESKVRTFIQHALHTPLPQLPGFLAPSIDALDVALDPIQAHAVASALNTPDLFVIEGVTGTGKSRCIIELVRQAVLLRWHVLVVSPSSASLDSLMERFLALADIWPERLLGREETASRLSETAQDHLEERWPDRMRERATQMLQRRIAERQKQLALLESTPALFDRIGELVERCRTLDQSKLPTSTTDDSLTTQAAEWSERLNSESAVDDPFLAPLYSARLELNRHSEETKAGIDAELQSLEAARQQGQELTARAEALQPLAQTRQQGQWWKPQFWQALLSGDTTTQQNDLVEAIAQREASIQQIEAQIVDLRQQQTERESAVQDAEQAAFERESNRLRDEDEQRRTAAQQERSRLDEGFRKMNAMVVAAGGFAVDTLSVAAVETGRQKTAEQRKTEQSLLDFDVAWGTHLSTHIDSLIQSVQQGIQVTFSPVNAPSLQNHLSRRGCAFQMMIVEDAQWLSEPEFLQLARCASRWVVVGEHAHEAVDNDSADRRPRTGNRTPPNRARRKLPDFFARLCQRLGRTVWTHESGRLCVQLMPILAEQRRFIESESVADHPDIELRIYTPEEGEPGLAEVLFPEAMTLPQAKDYLFRELNEVTVQWFGPGRWSVLPDGTHRWGHYPLHGDEPTVCLEPGIVEYLYPNDATFDTLAIDFRPADGWDQSSAEGWLRRHLVESPRTPNRVIELSRLHRMRPALGAWLSEVVFNGRCPEPALGTPRDYEETCVDFHPVPGFGEDRRRDPAPRSRRDSARRIPTGLRSGAGLDTDLSDPKARERIPAEFAARLPATGMVNLNEAQAIVQHLQSVELTRTIGISALYPAQIELLRMLVADAQLANIEVVTPDDLCAREYEVLVLSLTRSHGSRAVTFGDDPRETLRLLTRARQRLVLFGDPGTLVRRSQWEGPVDHLDARAAEQEHSWVGQLVRYLQGVGQQPRVFQLHEGMRL